MDDPTRMSTITSMQVYPVYYAVGVSLISLVGIALHILSIIVLSRKFMLSAASFYLMALSMFDLIHLFSMELAYCTSPILSLAGHNISDLTKIDSIPAKLFIKIFPVLEISQALISVYIFALTLEYYNYIFKETHARKVLNDNSSQNTVFLIFGVTVLFHLPTIFKMEIIHLDIGGSQIVKMCTSTLFLKNSIQVYERIMMPILFGWLPVFGSITLAIIIFIRVRRQKERRVERMTPTSYHLRQGRSLIAVYLINLFHFTLYVPILVATALNISRTNLISPIVLCFRTFKDISLSAMEQHWELICVTLALVDSSSRFLFYYAFNRPFSYTLHRMCVCNYFEVNKGPPTIQKSKVTLPSLSPNKNKARIGADKSPTRGQDLGRDAGRDNRAFTLSEPATVRKPRNNHNSQNTRNNHPNRDLRNINNSAQVRKPDHNYNNHRNHKTPRSQHSQPPNYSTNPTNHHPRQPREQRPTANQDKRNGVNQRSRPNQGHKGQNYPKKQTMNQNHVNSNNQPSRVILNEDSDVSESWI